MRRSEKEITDPADIEDVLRSAKILHLGLCDGDEPYVVPLSYGYADRVLYFHCAPKGRKLDVMARNDRVCFEVVDDSELVLGDEACKSGFSFRSVIGFGRASLVEDHDAKVAALEVIMAQYAEGPFHFDPKNVRATAVVRIDIESTTGKRG